MYSSLIGLLKMLPQRDSHFGMSITNKDEVSNCVQITKKSLNIPKGYSESVNRRTDNTMDKRKGTKSSLKMLEFLIDNIFVMFHGRGFQQAVGIHMGTHCVPPLVDLFLYSYKTYFIQGLLKISEKKLARSFIFTFSYIDDVLPLNKIWIW